MGSFLIIMNKYIEIFKNFLRSDKEFVEILIPRFHHEMELLGQYIEKKSSRLYCSNKEELSEFLDFIDGNGFEIEYEEPTLPWDVHPYKIIPIYMEEIIENEKQEEEEERPVFMEFSVPQVVLHETSMETYAGYWSECKEYVAPCEVRFCIYGCLEFLRLVPEGRCGSSPVPRPP